MFARLFGQKKATAVAAEWFPFDHRHQGGDLKALLGGKGAGLVEMTKLGIPVPPGFTMPTPVCLSYLDSGWTEEMDLAVQDGLRGLETRLDKRLEDAQAPLLLSVRLDAKFSMPGMTDTVLNAGMTADVAHGLAQVTGDARFAWDTYKRAVTGFAQIVLVTDPAALAAPERAANGFDARGSGVEV